MRQKKIEANSNEQQQQHPVGATTIQTQTTKGQHPVGVASCFLYPCKGSQQLCGGF